MFLLTLLLFSLVKITTCITICDSECACRIDNKLNVDYQGEFIDCSYRDAGILKTNNTLPNTAYSLDLSSANISIIDTSLLFQSTTLYELLLNNNKLRRIDGNHFKLPNVKRLDLSYNQLEFIDKESFRDLKTLEYFNIANNRFTTFDKLAFHHLSNLNEVILNNNNLGASLENNNLFDRSGFGLTQKIQIVSISGINLNKVPDNFFVDAYDIRKLIISNNNLTDVFEIPFTLQYLDLSDNPITEISTEDFTDLPGLNVLKLNNLWIEEVPDFVFEHLHSLTSLELERNKNLTQFSKLAFGKGVLEDPYDFTLHSFSLRNSRLTTLDKDLLDAFGQFTELDLQGNPWHCDCNLIWLKRLQLSTNAYDHFRCATPPSLYNARIFDLKAKYFTCQKKHIGIIMGIVSFCIILALVAVWMFVCVPKKHSRSSILRNMWAPSAAYTVLPMTPNIDSFNNT
ncbi:hypothetical protein K1T71_001064 [Dendrolimus kikuchii]|uniref:Uncharacterized protein n=1 Tax=Dendrolimus kikuchii TaxID=765133 RepID=A0ACC1DHF3_9NEOP|nr:hypothetical protein K1T71_001064 [Dendrolimus kikuchii]